MEEGDCLHNDSKIINFEDVLLENEPHVVSEVVCLKCLRRWIAVRPEKTLLKNLECPSCGPGFIIETGENICNSIEGDPD